MFSNEQIRMFRRDARKRYGDGWRYLSEDQQRNAEAREILGIILGQQASEYYPAQKAIRCILQGFKNLPERRTR